MLTFQDLGLKPGILKALEDLGFETPTAIQAKAIPFLIESERDLFGFAQTGTGKTAAFSLPVLHQLDADNDAIQAIILCPTRELCLQIRNDIQLFLKHTKELHVTALYGGEPVFHQVKELRKCPQIVVGTPGRVLDLINRRKLNLSTVNYLILDEADEMLNMGFKDELDAIIGETPKERQSLLFSATMPKEVEQIAREYLTNPHEIAAASPNSGVKTVEHKYCVVRGNERYEALKRIADINANIYGIVFCRTRMETKEVAAQLMSDGYYADALHGDLSQQQREYVMDRFRGKSIRLLVATDVAARGIDVKALTHVIHYKIPEQLENYVHRSGRTGRAGNKGESIALVTGRDQYKIRNIEKTIGQEFSKMLIPTGEEVCKQRLLSLVEKIKGGSVSEEITPFLPTLFEHFEEISKEDIIKLFVSEQFSRVLEYYKGANDLNVKDNKRSKDRERGGESGGGQMIDFARFHMNLGNKHKITPPKIIGMINDSLGVRNIEIGKIEILNGFAYFEIDAQYESRLLDGFKKSSVNVSGISVVVERTKDKPRTQEVRGGGRRGGGGGGDRRFRRSSGGGKSRNFSGGRKPKRGVRGK